MSRESIETVGHFQINTDRAACRKPLYIPLESGSESSFVQQGWMKQIRNRANVCSHLFDQGFAVCDGSSRFPEALNIGSRTPQFYRSSRHALPNAVMSFATDSASLL